MLGSLPMTGTQLIIWSNLFTARNNEQTKVRNPLKMAGRKNLHIPNTSLFILFISNMQRVFHVSVIQILPLTR